MSEVQLKVESGKQKNGGDSVDPVIINLGKRKRKDIRRLNKGKGRLFSKVLEAHAHLKSSGLAGDAEAPVVVLVKEKKQRRGKRFRYGGFGFPW